MCKINCPSDRHLQQHCASAAHYRHAAASPLPPPPQGQQPRQPPPPPLPAAAADPLWCNMCSVRASNEATMDAHVRGARHKAGLLQRAHAAGGGLGAERGGVRVVLLPAEVTGLTPGDEQCTCWCTTPRGRRCGSSA